jgi:exopolyphosphatase/guanosine-5'-triphosphate,3'-diphosphate pyrophosphatase
VASIPVGCLGVLAAEACGGAGPWQALQQAASAAFATHQQQVDAVMAAAARIQQQEEVNALRVVVTGGTVTTLAALHLRLQQYDHDAVHMCDLQRSSVQELAQALLAGAPHTQPPWLSAKRADSLLPGCATLLALLDALGRGVEAVLVSDSDLLDGLMQQLLLSPERPPRE